MSRLVTLFVQPVGLRRILGRLALLAAPLLLAACASGPNVRSDYDPQTDFARYHTFAFFSPAGTDRSGYSTLLTDRLRRAARAELDAATINTNYALPAGLNPTKDAIAMEAAKGPYANVIVVQEKNKDAAWVHKLIKVYHSAEIKKFIDTEFKGSVLTTW